MPSKPESRRKTQVHNIHRKHGLPEICAVLESSRAEHIRRSSNDIAINLRKEQENDNRVTIKEMSAREGQPSARMKTKGY
jgi:hypothetical protein